MELALDPATRQRIEALCNGARRSRWDPDTGVDWTVAPRPPRLLPKRFLSMALGALIAGEEAAAGACRDLIAALPLGPERDCLALQADDEARHAALYRRYLGRLGLAAVPPEGFAAATDALCAWRGPPAGQIVAVHVVLEGEALAAQTELLDDIPCPLFAALTRRIARDEARHVAFGRLIGPAIAHGLGEDGRRATVAEIETIWRSCVAALARDSILLSRAIGRHAARRWRVQSGLLAAMGLTAGRA